MNKKADRNVLRLSLMASGAMMLLASTPLARAADALNDLMNRRVKGKAVLVT